MKQRITGVVLAGLMAWMPMADALAGFPDYFDSRAQMSRNLKAFDKWLSVMQRYDNGRQSSQWKEFIASQRGKSRGEQIRAVNAWFNRIPYKIDLKTWGKADHWATPTEFMQKNAGDCEDYAIAKFMALKALGFSNSEMRIVILDNTAIKELHAVLVVDSGGEALVLDNYIKQVVPASRVHHYKPIYSINETAWWRHR